MKIFYSLIILPLMLSGCVSDNSDLRYPYAPMSSRMEQRVDGPSEMDKNKPTQVIILGTGMPFPDAYRAGSSIAVIHKGEAYLFDVGAGAVRRAVEARYKYDIAALYPSQIKAVFITHMHSDHTMDFAELSQTLWWSRRDHLQAYGPVGTQEMVDGMYAMMAPDTRIREGGKAPGGNPTGYQVDVTEIESGKIFDHDGMTVEAFRVPHGKIEPSFGYKIVTDDLTIVISGDTSLSEIVQEKSIGVDILFHEVMSDEGSATLPVFWQDYHGASHTLASQIGKLAAKSRPKKIVLYHGLFFGTREQHIVDEIKQYYDGEVILANDLDLFLSHQ
jgi:ribonuclease Z